MGNQQLRIGGITDMEFKEKLIEIFKENNIKVLKYVDEKSFIQYKCLDCGQVYEYKSARNLLSKITLCKKCYNPYGRWNKERLQERLNRLFPESRIEIISFLSFRKGGTLKCSKCGEEERINNFEALLSARKDYFCNNCEKEKDKIFHHMEQELSKGKIRLVKWNGVNEKADFCCLRCGHLFSKNVKMNFNGSLCPNCFKAYNKFSFKDAQEFLDKVGNGEYTLLQYKGSKFRTLIKHKCGFCFSTHLASFEKTRGCPKCYRKISRGEQLVKGYLEKEKNSLYLPKTF